MIFFKLTDYYKISDIYVNHNNCLGTYVNYVVIVKYIYKVCYNMNDNPKNNILM